MNLATMSDHWYDDLEAALCPACDRRFLSPAGESPQRCPLCLQEQLIPLEIEADLLPYTKPPELAIPFSIPEAHFSARVTDFARSIPFAPSDLTPENFRQRARRIFLPHWLVDAGVQADFQTEVGFDFEVVSHRERYAGGGWQTEEVKEGRVRWEPRAGRLRREYANVVAPALEAESTWQRQLGQYDRLEATPYEPRLLDGTSLALPDRSPADAWPDAIPAIRLLAREESRRAAHADHIRDFRWVPEYGGRNWTQLLRPIYATYYQDDEGVHRPVILNGQSGQISGSRRASMARARRLALGLGISAALAMLGALLLALAGIFLEALLVSVAVVGLGAAFLLLLGALVPLAIVWRFNRQSARFDLPAGDRATPRA